ncbi:MAG: DUF4168 domain-containing protein [Bacteroidota bacterium]
MLLRKMKLKEIVLSIVIVLTGLTAMGQQMPMQEQAPPAPDPSSYSDEQVENFAGAVMEVMTIQEERQTEMMQSIEENGLSVDRFNEMLMEGQQKGQTEIEASEEEMEAFNESMAQVQQMQQDMQNEMMAAVADNGLEMQQYQEMMQGYEQYPEMKEKVDGYIDEKMQKEQQ